MKCHIVNSDHFQWRYIQYLSVSLVYSFVKHDQITDDLLEKKIMLKMIDIETKMKLEKDWRLQLVDESGTVDNDHGKQQDRYAGHQ